MMGENSSMFGGENYAAGITPTHPAAAMDLGGGRGGGGGLLNESDDSL
jgi:hypothetical protein